MQIKFMFNGIKIDGNLYRAFYSFGGYIHAENEGAITIYRKGYGRTPRIEGLACKNDTDIQSDYFEKDRFLVTKSNKWYPEVLAAYNKQQAYREKRKKQVAVVA